jgi:hypothetical protein
MIDAPPHRCGALLSETGEIDSTQHFFIQALIVGRARAGAHSVALAPLRHGMA